MEPVRAELPTVHQANSRTVPAGLFMNHLTQLIPGRSFMLALTVDADSFAMVTLVRYFGRIDSG